MVTPRLAVEGLAKAQLKFPERRPLCEYYINERHGQDRGMKLTSSEPTKANCTLSCVIRQEFVVDQPRK